MKSLSAPKGEFCVNHSYCSKYSDLDCASEWVQLNCPRMCRLCEYEGIALCFITAEGSPSCLCPSTSASIAQNDST